MYQTVFGVYLCFVVLIIYFSTEHWWWHSSQAFENRFWGCWAACVTMVVLYAPDSPAFMLMEYRTWYIDFLLCYSSFVCMRGFVRYQEQLRLGQVGTPFEILFQDVGEEWYIEDRTQTPSSELSRRESRKPSMVAVQTSEDITTLVKKLQYNLASTTARALSNRGIIDTEQSIIDALACVADEDLSRIVTSINVAQLVFNVRDHYRFSDNRHKEDLLDLLCVRRLDVLDPAARAALLNALMVSDTLRTHPRGPEWAKSIFLNTHSTELHLVKLMLDNTGTYHSLHKLVYMDIADEKVREEILGHIAREAQEFKQNLTSDVMLSKSSDDLTSLLPFADLSIEARRKQAPYIKIFSDVDDTLYCSGGDGIAGLDSSFPRKVVYPGVVEFYRQLEIGADDDLGIWSEGRLGNLVFLSARPHVYKDVSERASYSLFNRLRKEKGMHCTPTMLAGQANMETVTSMTLSQKGLYLARFEPIKNKKLQNYLEFIALWPEYTTVFVGDNGQGDVMVAAEAIEMGCPVEGAFIHKVIPLDNTFGYEEGCEEKWSRLKINFFHSYVGAAVQAYEMGLVSANGVQEVAEKARAELIYVLEHTPTQGRGGWPIEKRRAWIEAFNEDIAAANEYTLVGAIEEVPLPELPPEPQPTEAEKTESATTSAVAQEQAAQDAVRLEVLKAVKSALSGLLPRRATTDGNIGAISALKEELGEVVQEAMTGTPGEAGEHAHGRPTTASDLAAEAVTELVESIQDVVGAVAMAAADVAAHQAERVEAKRRQDSASSNKGVDLSPHLHSSHGAKADKQLDELQEASDAIADRNVAEAIERAKTLPVFESDASEDTRNEGVRFADVHSSADDVEAAS